ncbi:hypothetical protein FEM03_08190 [Phragmitibacter flavus]|uniref:Helix-turn-helix domain-containing protein n=1 Tax=Phragmitibacter flavus TaxID=2576071 RepID=A0A5R8KGQ5_9BACT|nr:hypothetical protein [Phragmitibacter flavus]TLD71494.1 hypothetical protein FEM03_08190 [Phragmitibacter flavus]
MTSESASKRVAYSPGEFAELFGKSQTWGYRQIYGGKVTAITEHGRILIPAKEVERVLESAGIYNGKEKPKLSKQGVKKLTPEQLGKWEQFVKSRRQKTTSVVKDKGKQRDVKTSKTGTRKSILNRVAKSWRGKSKSV